ncbi:MAG TPA: DUF1345 domain-containing protein [Mycobacteriales bacterium]|nr:DUF1345 domain-containing protein [Mycobacteriales bacterium]
MTTTATRPRARGGSPTRTRLLVAAGAFVAVATLTALLGSPGLAPLVGWDVAAAVLLVWTWSRVWPLDGVGTAARAVREDPSRGWTDAVLLAAAVASLIAVGAVIFRAGHGGGTHEIIRVSLGVGSVVLAWAVVHTVFTLSYARLYYTGARGGVNFNQDAPPRYADFAYLSFTIGMTFQVSDTNLEATDIRATALRHALLSYLFGAVIVAITINLVAGLSK